MLLALLVFAPRRVAALLERVVPEEREALLRQQKLLGRPDPRTLVLELRRLLDRRFEGLERVHPSWLLAALSDESSLIREAWLAELPTHAQKEETTQKAPAWAAELLRARFTQGLVEMPPEPKERAFLRQHIVDLPEPLFARLFSLLRPGVIGGALAGLGDELARRLAQRLPYPQGQELLEGYQTPAPDALPMLQRALEKLGITMEEGVL